jgi:hypothetical protein
MLTDGAAPPADEVREYFTARRICRHSHSTVSASDANSGEKCSDIFSNFFNSKINAPLNWQEKAA